MRAVLGSFLILLALLLMPGAVLVPCALVFAHALKTLPTLADSLNTVPIWAQVYLAVAVAAGVLAPVTILVATAERSRERDEALPL